MQKFLHQIWNDPVLSKVIASLIIALLGAIWAVMHFHWWQNLRAFFSRQPKPRVTVLDVRVESQTSEKPLSYPLKCYAVLQNDSPKCADVSISEYKFGAVTLKAFTTDVLTVKFHEFVPKDHGVQRAAVLPGQQFQFWIGIDEKKFNAAQIDLLRGRIGTMILLVNGQRIPVDM